MVTAFLLNFETSKAKVITNWFLVMLAVICFMVYIQFGWLNLDYVLSFTAINSSFMLNISWLQEDEADDYYSSHRTSAHSHFEEDLEAEARAERRIINAKKVSPIKVSKSGSILVLTTCWTCTAQRYQVVSQAVSPNVTEMKLIPVGVVVWWIIGTGSNCFL